MVGITALLLLLLTCCLIVVVIVLLSRKWREEGRLYSDDLTQYGKYGNLITYVREK
jgi:hypothetical protein